MNIPKLTFVNNLQNKIKTHNLPIKHHGLQCDTVSFCALDKLTYNDVLIYDETFSPAYEDLEIEYKKAIDKKLEDIKSNNRFSGNSTHGIKGCPGLNEYISSGGHAYRILFKIVDGTLVIISCLQKNIPNSKADKIYDKARAVAKSGELDVFVDKIKQELKDGRIEIGLNDDVDSNKDSQVGVISDVKEEEKNINQQKAIEVQKSGTLTSCEDTKETVIAFYDDQISQIEKVIESLSSNKNKAPDLVFEIADLLEACKNLEEQIELKKQECLEEFEKANSVSEESELDDYFAMQTLFNEIANRYEEILSGFESEIGTYIKKTSEIAEKILQYEIGKVERINTVESLYKKLIENLKSTIANLDKKQSIIEKEKLDEPTYNDEILCDSAKKLYNLYETAKISLEKYIPRLSELLSIIEQGLSEKSAEEEIHDAEQYANAMRVQVEDLVKYYLMKIETAENELIIKEEEYKKLENEALKERNERMLKKFGRINSEDIQEASKKDALSKQKAQEENEIPDVVLEDTPITIKTPAGEKPQIIIPRTVSFSNKTREMISRISANMLPINIASAEEDVAKIVVSILKLEENPDKLEKTNISDFKSMLGELNRRLSTSVQYKNIVRSTLFALLSVANSNSIANSVQMARNGEINMDEVEAKYAKLSQPLSENEKTRLQNAIFRYCPHLNQQEKIRVVDLLSKQAKYMNLLVDENSDKETVKQVLQLFWGDFGKPEYAKTSIMEYEKELRDKFIEENTFVDDDDFE